MPISGQPATGTLDLVASAGATRAATFRISTVGGIAVTGWDDATDTLAVQVWAGDSTRELDTAGVTASFTDDANGVIEVVTDGTHEIASGKYHWRCLATSAGKTYEIIRGSMEVLQTPDYWSGCSTTTERTPYTTIDDLRTVAPWIEQLQGQYDRTGLMEHQLAARDWLDDVVLGSYRSAQHPYYGYRQFGLNGWQANVDEPSKWLSDVLATGTGINITPELKRACALFACSQVCMAQSVTDESASVYRKKAAELRYMAANAITGRTVYVKANTTAVNFTVPINLGISRRN